MNLELIIFIFTLIPGFHYRSFKFANKQATVQSWLIDPAKNKTKLKHFLFVFVLFFFFFTLLACIITSTVMY
jgi:hypothetical protein